MRRAVGFSLAATVVVFLLAALLLIEIRRPAPWQDELTGYLARLSAQGDAARLLAVQRASAPHAFDGRLSRAVWGNESYTAKPLSYPPDRLFCVQLEHAGVPSRQVVFVALHTDLYTADWVVHEGAYGPFGPEFASALAGLGCASVLDVGQ